MATMLRSPWAATLLVVGIGLVVVGTFELSRRTGSFSAPADSTRTGSTHAGIEEKPAAFKQHVTWQRSEVNGTHHLLVHFTPSEGVWRPGETLTFQIRLEQPCDSWRISGGFDELTESVGSARTNTTEINVSTRSVPKPGEDVVIDVAASVPPVIDQVAMSPREPDSPPGP